MSSTAAHTQTPWVNRNGAIESDDGWIHIASVIAYFRENEAVQAANADFIVRACNSHEQLVTALRNLIAATDAYSTMHAPDGDDAARMVEYAEALNNARAALAAAGAA